MIPKYWDNGYMKFQRGFTLIELLVVIAIISLLSSVVLASVRQSRDKAAYARFDSEYLQLRTAIELYRSDNNGEYPSSITTFGTVDSVVSELNQLGYFSADVLAVPNGYQSGYVLPANSTTLAEAVNFGIIDYFTCGGPNESDKNYSLVFNTESHLTYTSKLPPSYVNGSLSSMGRDYCIGV